MKLLLFSDVHCSVDHCNELVRKSALADIVIGAGDFGIIREGLETTIKMLQKIQKPTILVPGNSESLEELEKACLNWESANVLHGSGIELSGIKFYGVGGGIPITPFGDWSYDFSEEEARELLLNCPESCVLVTHSPPKGAVDISSSGQSFGSQAILKTIIEKKPLLCVCGHIHESAGRSEKIGETPVVNAGPNGIFWEVK
ncbi:MAG: metallophosphoesterase family protein [Deltaproteobacteria bacterium]|nr:metallophosphoesterase family protein [Deltaproteobacteria bacterium]